jgi:23S rRNA (cytosine1962-C5)-methyltransferase
MSPAIRTFRPVMLTYPDECRISMAAHAPSEDKTRGQRGAGPALHFPLMLETGGWSDYALVDSGHGRKLERYGRYRIIRPEPQALWTPKLSGAEWERADAVFTGEDDDSDGRWRYLKPLPEDWPMAYGAIRFTGRFTSFRHVGVFPEQEAHWRWMADILRTAKRPTKVLNLFGYTGLASFVAAAEGGTVTHIDASKKAIAWARENQALSGMADKPIRWIMEDAMKFIRREQRRGSRYDGIILDPPKFGRGPNGEVFDLFVDLPELMQISRELLADDALFLVLTAYSIRASFMAIHELSAEVLAGRGGKLESGELLLREESGGRLLSTSLFSRWSRA